MLYNLYLTVLYQPLFNILVGLYNLVGNDIGLAIIVLTLLIRIVLYPLTLKQLRATKIQAELQPQIDALREKYKDDKEKQSQELMKLYSSNKINPLSSCLPALLQLIILWPLYRVFFHGLTSQDFTGLYSFISNPGSISTLFLGFIDLAVGKNIILAVLAGALQFVQSWMLMAKQKKQKGADNKPKDAASAAAQSMQSATKTMTYLFPLLTVWFGYSLPAGLSLYWIVSTLFSIGQQYYIQRSTKPKDDIKAVGEEA